MELKKGFGVFGKIGVLMGARLALKVHPVISILGVFSLGGIFFFLKRADILNFIGVMR